MQSQQSQTLQFTYNLLSFHSPSNYILSPTSTSTAWPLSAAPAWFCCSKSILKEHRSPCAALQSLWLQPRTQHAVESLWITYRLCLSEAQISLCENRASFLSSAAKTEVRSKLSHYKHPLQSSPAVSTYRAALRHRFCCNIWRGQRSDCVCKAELSQHSWQLCSSAAGRYNTPLLEMGTIPHTLTPHHW